MATSNKQRIGIMIILVATILGTLGGFVAMILSVEQGRRDAEVAKQQQDKLTNEMKAYQQKTEAQKKMIADKTPAWSEQHFADVKQYEARVSEFNAGDVKELKKEDLVVGTGDEIKDTATSLVYYIGWTPDGKVFDGSIDGDKLKSPLVPSAVIQGWKDGIVGMKVGGVRELTIPANLAYGKEGSGDKIKADTPIKFVVKVIEKVEPIPMPDYAKLLQLQQ